MKRIVCLKNSMKQKALQVEEILDEYYEYGQEITKYVTIHQLY